MAKKNNPTRKLLVILGILAVLAVIIIVVIATSGVFSSGNRAIDVETEEALERNITQLVTASGKVRPEIEVKISPDVSGEIVELRVKEGDIVNKGELLVRIKQDDYISLVEQAEAGVSQAKATQAQQRASMLNAELDLNRQTALYEADAISEGELQTARTQYDVAVATHEASVYGVQSAEARLRESRERLAKTTIYAPMSGTVSKLDVEFGERVVGTSQMQGTEMMRIARLNQMELEVDVNENDVVNIALGDSALVEIDAYPDRSFRGIVTEIANSARVTA
ncbi:MAG: efflux RND transporter periplasmic adaptor subunit, partial [Rhodothermales bacterium]|nr:efflux RND transporter periplasmic adaptor subunit [Rhodothermales bacterium]